MKTSRSSRQSRSSKRSSSRSSAWFRPQLEQLETRLAPAIDYTAFASSLADPATGLGAIQSAIERGLDSASNLPIIGNQVGSLASVLPLNVVHSVETAVAGLEPSSSSSSPPTQSAIQDAIAGAFGGMVVNGSAGVTVTPHTGDIGDSIEIEVELRKDVSAPTGNLNVNLGLKSLPVTIATTGGVQVGVGFDYELAFIYDHGTFSIDTGAKLPSGHQLDLTADATLTSGFSATATLGFFTATATDEKAPVAPTDPPGTPTEFKAMLSLDQLGAGGTPTLDVGGTANLNLHLDAAIGGSGDTDSFPSVGTNFELHWAFNGTDTTGSAPTVAFNDVTMSAGTLFSKVLEPVVDTIQTFTHPIQPFIDVLKAPLPGLSDLSHLVGGGDVTLEGIAQKLAGATGDPELEGIVSLATTLVDLSGDINKIDTSGNNLMIDFGSFSLGGTSDDLRNDPLALPPSTTPDGTNLTNLAPQGVVKDAVQTALTKVVNAGGDISAAQNALDFINRPNDGVKFDFPILDDPGNGIFKLILGQDVSLFTLTVDEHFNSQESSSFPVLGILDVGFDAAVKVDLHVEVGYDTLGIREFLKDGNVGDLADGLYVSSDTAFNLSGNLNAFASATVLIFSAGVTGGVTIPTTNPLQIVVHNPTPSSGHIPFSKLDTSDLFDASGELDAGLSAFVKVGIDTPFGFVGWENTFPIANVKLLDFGASTMIPEGGLPPPQPPSIATQDSMTGVVTLSIGDYATDLVGYTAPADGGANYSIAKDPSDATATDVTAFGFTQVFHNVTSVFADGTYYSDPSKTGADAITFLDGVAVPAELHGNKVAASNSLSYRGSGQVKLYAGDQGDVLYVGNSDDAGLYGGAGNDVLTAGNGNGDVLVGGGGDDNLTAGNGNNDSLDGGEGNDQLEAGNGQADVLIGGGGDDIITVRVGDHTRAIYADAGPGQSVVDPGVVVRHPGADPEETGGDTLIVLGGDGADTLNASANGSAVQVTTQTFGDLFVGSDFEKLVLDGGKGADTVNINNLTSTTLTQVVANQNEATEPDGAADVVNVDASGASGAVFGLTIDQSAGVVQDAVVSNDPSKAHPKVLGTLAQINGLSYQVFAPLNEAQNTLAVNNVPTTPFPTVIDTLRVDSRHIFVLPMVAPDPIPMPGLLIVRSAPATTLDVFSTAGPTVLYLGDGDAVTAASLGFPSVGIPGHTLDGLQGPVTVHGDGIQDSLLVDDSGVTTFVSGTLTGTAITGLDLGNPAGIVYDGLSAVSVTLGSGVNNQFNVQGTAAGTNTSVAGSTGTESFNVGSKQNNSAVSDSILDTIQGPLTISGTGADHLFLDDTGSMASKIGTLTDTIFTGMSMGPQGITYGGLSSLGIFLGTGGDTIDVQSTAAPTTTNIGASAGQPNTFNVGSLAPASGGIVDHIAGPLTIVGSGADTTNVDDTGSTTPKTGQLTATTLTGMGMGPQGITYGGLSSLNVFVGTGGDTINIQSTAAPTTTTIDPPAGSPNTFNVGSLAPILSGGIVDNIAGPLVIVGGGGDIMNVDDSGSTTPKTGTLTASTLTGLHMAGITYSGLAILNVGLGSGGNALGINVSGGTNLPATTTINGGPSSSDSLTAAWAQDFNGTLNLLGFEQATIQVGRDFNGALSDTQPGNIQSLAVGGSVTSAGKVIAGGNLTQMTVGPNAFSPGHDMAGQVIVGGTLADLRVAGGTPGNVIAGHVGTIRTYGGYGPYVLQVLENGIQRRVEAAVPASPYPLLHSPPQAPSSSPTGVTFQYFYESGGLANPQLTARVTNGNSAADQYDLSLVTYNDAAKFNLARLDAAGISGIRNVTIEGDLLTSVTAAASSFTGDNTAAGVRLGQDVLAGVAIRDYAPNGFIQARSIQAVAFGSHTRPDGRIETGAVAHQDDAARLLAPGTAVVQANDTFRVPFADLPAQQVGFFLATDEHGGHFDDHGIAFTVQGVSTPNATRTGNVVTPSNVARGAVTALIAAVQTFDQHGNLEDSVVQTVALRGDGASFLTEQYIAVGVTSTGPLGDLTYQAAQGITDVTASSIFGSILPNGPITGTVQTTGQRTDPITGVTTAAPADLGRLFVTLTDHGPILTTTTVTVKGPGLSGRLLVRGNLISQVSSDGGISGVVAVQGNIAETNAPDKDGHPVRLGGIVSNGPLTGQLVVLGTVFGDVTIHGGLQGGRIAIRGGLLGNTTIDGGIDAGGALVTAGAIGDATAGTALLLDGDVKGILAAAGAISFARVANTMNAAYFQANGAATDPASAAAIDALFTRTFDGSPLDLAGLNPMLAELASLQVQGGKLRVA